MKYLILSMTTVICFNAMYSNAQADTANRIVSVSSDGQNNIADTNDIVYKYVDEMPVPEYDFNSLINNRLAPYKTQGGIRVAVTIVFDETGNLTNVKPISPKFDKYITPEIIEVISNMPRWVPGKQNGIPVKVQYAIPFQL